MADIREALRAANAIRLEDETAVARWSVRGCEVLVTLGRRSEVFVPIAIRGGVPSQVKAIARLGAVVDGASEGSTFVATCEAVLQVRLKDRHQWFALGTWMKAGANGSDGTDGKYETVCRVQDLVKARERVLEYTAKQQQQNDTPVAQLMVSDTLRLIVECAAKMGVEWVHLMY